jgi:hypothetical protein
MKTGILFLSVMLLSFGCDNNGDLSKGNNTIVNVTIPPLNGTQWELAGIVDVETNTLTELEPEECEKCRTITFDTDTTVLNVDSIKFRDAKINELFAGRLYIKSLLITNNKLKIFYNAGKSYLLYEPINEDDDTEPTVYPVNIAITDISLDCLKEDTEILSIINSQEELMQRMFCEIMPHPVDFDKYSLLVVSGRATSGIDELTRQLTQTSSSEYVLKIDIKLNATREVPLWTVSVLAPKLPQDATIELVVSKNNGDNEKNEDCSWNAVESVLLSEDLNIKLNTVFSEQNQLLKNVIGDTIVFVINNEQDFLKVCDDQAIISGMDFEKYSIVWGRVLSSSISDKIDRKQLFECPEYTRYKYDIAIEKCVECWTALGYLYFWDVYLKKINNENITLTVK